MTEVYFLSKKLDIIYAGSILAISLFFITSSLVDVYAVEQVTVEEASIEEKITLQVTKKLPHAVSITADFEGKFDRKMINTSGEYKISNDVNTFVLVGTFDETGVSHYDPILGKYVITNPNCSNITAELVLESKDTKINLDYTGKNCHYGFFSYVIGTFEVTDSTGQYEGIEGNGRITFVADHHNNNVSGELKGSFE